ncbi:Cytochrome C biogenesis protein [uncultured spirochete]|jgi:ABC-type transport system involved in cytochrome c biogenesis permease subunit|uniref:Heme exporter protein C n=1 Tax=uncultured spirochete TaxID=156406 RepID=A0A3P3XL44_9SPIR|nr:cytochrome c biogenesis protein CcsA [Rectinema subterraneum]SLM14581.1 Cytochrome C biogenesis protein [uncultured spirochete]
MIATIAFGLLLLSLVIQIVFLFKKEGGQDGISPWLSLAAGILLLVEIVRRSIAIRFVALTGMFESLIFLACFLALLIFALRYFKSAKGNRVIPFGATIIAVIFLALASSPLAPSDIKPPIPALQSGWLVLHVSFTFIGEVFFAVGFVSAILQLVSKDEEKRRSYDRITYTSIAVGYPIFTAGALIFGAIWAEKAWGVWWSWDPKETWALITWLTYTAYLHFRLVRKSTSKLVPALVIIGFVIAMFTFFGVNFLLKGLHSYA